MELKNVRSPTSMQCPQCKRFMKRIRDPVSSTDGYQCMYGACPGNQPKPTINGFDPMAAEQPHRHEPDWR